MTQTGVFVNVPWATEKKNVCSAAVGCSILCMSTPSCRSHYSPISLLIFSLVGLSVAEGGGDTEVPQCNLRLSTLLFLHNISGGCIVW